MIRIQERPRKNILKANISNWTAGHNPVVYKLKREDFKILNTINGLGFKVEIIFFEDISSFVEVGNSIYLKSGIYDTIAEVISIDVTGKRLLTNIQFESTTSGGYANLKQNYYTLIDVFSWESNQKLTKNSLKFTGDVTGKITADFSSLLQSFFEYQHDFLFTDVVKDVNNYLGFYIKVEERFKNKSIFDTFQINDISNPTFVSNSSKQLGDLYGQNMGDYLTFPELYPALIYTLTYPDYFDYTKNFSYSKKYDLFLFIGGDLSYFYIFNYKTGYVQKQIPGGDIFLTIIDVFDDFNVIALLQGNDIVFIDLDDLFVNDTVTIIQTFTDYNASFKPKKIGNFIYSCSYVNFTYYQIDVSDFSVKTLNTGTKVGNSIAQYKDILVLAINGGGQGLMFVDAKTMTETSFLELGGYMTTIGINNKGEVYFYDIVNAVIKKIKSDGSIIQSDVFPYYPYLEFLFIEGEQNKFFARDEGRIVALDVNTLETVTSYENTAIWSSNWDFKYFNGYLGVFINNSVLYTKFLLLEVYEDKLAKFLTKFDEVPMWKDFPFDLSYIYTEKLERYQTFFRTVYYDKNKMIIDTIDFNISVQNLGAINRLSFNNMPENTCYFEVQVINTGIKSRDYDENDYIETQYN